MSIAGKDLRFLVLGGRHRVFRHIGHAIALRDKFGVREAEGASAGAIAMACGIGDISEAEGRTLVRAFDLLALRDLDPAKPPLLSFDRYLGRANGDVFNERMNEMTQRMGIHTWGDLRHTDETRPDGSTWSHRLGVRVAALTLKGAPPELAIRRQKEGRLGKLVFRELARGGHFDLNKFQIRTLPQEDARLFGPYGSMDHQPVGPWLVHSARHTVFFKFHLAKAANPNDTLVITDGAAPWSLEAMRTHVPEVPTVLLSFGRDMDDPAAQAEADRVDLPGYLRLRFPSDLARERKSLGMLPSLRIDLGADKQVELYDEGLSDIETGIEAGLIEDYLERWTDLRAEAVLTGTDRLPVYADHQELPPTRIANMVTALRTARIFGGTETPVVTTPPSAPLAERPAARQPAFGIEPLGLA